jgi:hypothetical protein
MAFVFYNDLERIRKAADAARWMLLKRWNNNRPPRGNQEIMNLDRTPGG